MLGTIRALDVPLPHFVGVDLTRPEALDVALTQIATGDSATVIDGDVDFADLFGGVVAALPTFRGATRQIATKDLTIVTTVAAAMIGLGALERAIIAADGAAAVTRPRAFQIASVALTVDDAFIEPFATAVVAAAGTATSDEKECEPEKKMS